ncbi:L,D-transpeptidase [Arthrobacter burdickii]|uniref:Ig-like domain-containing protein n=1 Tax=Arthrobacter burdickii TaxID=3035920 RepID=A0ABT8K533_9MICC|nr:Ig-like domain-containing protein [Arthrobacter burdickii]MDN4612545.1 Ig-like domain-containing protein [Arthrobacter burdickii]
MKQESNEAAARRKGWKIAAIGAAAVVVVGGGVGIATASPWNDASAGGSSSSASPSSAPQSAPAQTPPAAPQPAVSSGPAGEYTLGVTPTDQAYGVNPATVAAVTVEGATLDAVELVPSAGGTPVAGTISADGARWTATERLAFNTQYTFSYTVIDSAGQAQNTISTFVTVEPANAADASLFPLDGSTVGTGQPLEFTFSEPVTNRDAVEKAITVTSTSGQPGAFYWLSDTKVRYRPETFWAPNSTITVKLNLFGVDLGNGMIGNADRTMTVKTHNARIAVVDNATKTMNVYLDGKLDRTFPITLGTEEWPSTEGYMVVMEHYESTQFRAESIGLKPGDAAYYPPTVVNHASRLSNGGAFVHEALPGAQVALGSFNVSHGCIGMSPEGAEYFYNTFGPGDVVKILNTGYGPMYVWDGFGDWNVPWNEWVNQP